MKKVLVVICLALISASVVGAREITTQMQTPVESQTQIQASVQAGAQVQLQTSAQASVQAEAQAQMQTTAQAEVMVQMQTSAQADGSVTLNRKDDGFRGIWYYIPQADSAVYRYKYSGGLGTYPANHYPFAVYAPKVDKTFFCYGGSDAEGKTLLHEVSFYDHRTGLVARPTIIVDKKTGDAHDNPVMSIDKDGYVWVFSTSHGVQRPSYIHKSVKPYDIEQFELVSPTKIVDGKTVPMDNFSYTQIYYTEKHGYIALFTTYDRKILNNPELKPARITCFMTSRDGVEWSAWQPLGAIAEGHYQNAGIYKDELVGSCFNYHPKSTVKGVPGLDFRTNLYYIQTRDMGVTWTNIHGEKLSLPLTDAHCAALVRDYQAEGLNVYILEMAYTDSGYPVILYITSKGFESGPENGPRTWHVASWDGKKWSFNDITTSGNNYDFGSLYLEKDGTWRIIGTTKMGPQEYNTGGEVEMWTSSNQGVTWKHVKQLTANSKFNHTYPRKPIGANEGFYAMWADGHGREKSESALYFCDKRGRVFQLPREITPEMVVTVSGVEMIKPLPYVSATGK